jgi:hypothetical protein
MSDDQLEDTLRKYRPVNIGPDLRPRIFPDGQRDSRNEAWLWIPTAAALFLAAFLYHQAAVERAGALRDMRRGDAPHESIEQLAAELDATDDVIAK